MMAFMSFLYSPKPHFQAEVGIGFLLVYLAWVFFSIGPRNGIKLWEKNCCVQKISHTPPEMKQSLCTTHGNIILVSHTRGCATCPKSSPNPAQLCLNVEKFCVRKNEYCHWAKLFHFISENSLSTCDHLAPACRRVKIRDAFACHFSSNEGAVYWRDKHI